MSHPVQLSQVQGQSLGQLALEPLAGGLGLPLPEQEPLQGHQLQLEGLDALSQPQEPVLRAEQLLQQVLCYEDQYVPILLM